MLSNWRITQQACALACASDLGNVLILCTRADEAAIWTKDMLDREYEDLQHVHRRELAKVDLGFDNKKRGPWYVKTLYKLLKLLSGLV
jgi:hypothetical protein